MRNSIPSSASLRRRTNEAELALRSVPSQHRLTQDPLFLMPPPTIHTPAAETAHHRISTYPATDLNDIYRPTQRSPLITQPTPGLNRTSCDAQLVNPSIGRLSTSPHPRHPHTLATRTTHSLQTLTGKLVPLAKNVEGWGCAVRPA
ncbi:hypothetical protein BU26DRAFT_90658 [Trematosphaeria pertusa]|uniref:Uncharacterized protein n=1 Tax=Trematosphaeria pertusa TaxID=390896 RepID=A0A6A6I407_9PLEO|nr:uncharacterized protein BU26DRAFT_90658 [Trematosphaeria pertusa]KAF2245007.1 hypothetical protein BU26DRAFT_90658 [Trematosphaeria pertusa]